MNLKNSFVLILLVTSLFSCDKKRVFDQYKSVGSTWHKDSIVHFKLPKMDASKPYNLFVNLRDNNNYPFNNIFLLVSLEQPDGMTKVDTLEYEMAKPDGTLLGEGFTDVKENKLFYKEKFIFNQKGDYKVSIQQAVRQFGKVPGVKQLNGITEVGFRIESLE